MKTIQNYKKLFNPKSIAIVGASEKEGKVGTVITKNILELGYKGEIFFVNQSYNVLYGKKCFSSLENIKKNIELAIIAVPADFVIEIIEKASDFVKNFVIISAGFSEVGQIGLEKEKKLEEIIRKKNINILGPNCLGFIVPKIKLNASFAGGMPKAGNVALISQSGALAVALMDISKQQNISFSSIISIGNKMQIDESSLIEFLKEDKDTKVIAMYLEGIKDGKRFIEIAKKVSKIKPVIILKGGKSEKSKIAISSHTGALAGSDNIATVAFEKSGVLRAENLEHFFDLIKIISNFDSPKNNKVAIVTNAGGIGVLATDSFEKKNIELIELSKKEQFSILKNMPSEASAHNPIDILGDANENRYEFAIKTLQKNKNIGTLLIILTPQDQTPVLRITEKIIELKKRSRQIVVTSFVGGERVEKSVQRLLNARIINFSFPEKAINAIDAYYKWSKYAGISSFKINNDKKIDKKRSEKSAIIINNAKKQKRRALYYNEALEIMSLYNIPVAEAKTILPGENINETFKYPLILKIDSDTILHKSDKQGLVAGIKNEDELKTAFKKMQKNFPSERLIIQQMQDKKIEIILGIKNDENFGPVIMYGLGGIYAEIFKKVNFIIPPADKIEIENLLDKSSIGFIFDGLRGQDPYDKKEFVNILKNFIDFIKENPEIKEVDINPIFLYNDKKKASAVDVKIIF